MGCPLHLQDVVGKRGLQRQKSVPTVGLEPPPRLLPDYGAVLQKSHVGMKCPFFPKVQQVSTPLPVDEKCKPPVPEGAA